jgi:midasin
MSMQTESSDLLGGFRPVEARAAGSELLNRFLILFEGTFSRKKNARFEQSLKDAVYQRKWKRAIVLWRQALKMAVDKYVAEHSR